MAHNYISMLQPVAPAPVAPVPNSNQSAVLPSDPPPAYQPSAAQQVDTAELQRRQEVC